jgi:hypothetical protein
MGRIAGVAVVMAVLAAVAPGRFGGGDDGGAALRWDGRPRVSAMAGAPGDQLLFGRVVNRSREPVRLRAADVHVLDRDGDDLHTSAAFSDGYVAAVSLRGYGSELYAGDAAAGAVGQEVVLAPGASAPLSASFTVGGGAAAPAAVAVGKRRLALE